jgi:hypothetical protein
LGFKNGSHSTPVSSARGVRKIIFIGAKQFPIGANGPPDTGVRGSSKCTFFDAIAISQQYCAVKWGENDPITPIPRCSAPSANISPA